METEDTQQILRSYEIGPVKKNVSNKRQNAKEQKTTKTKPIG